MTSYTTSDAASEASSSVFATPTATLASSAPTTSRIRPDLSSPSKKLVIHQEVNRSDPFVDEPVSPSRVHRSPVDTFSFAKTARELQIAREAASLIQARISENSAVEVEDDSEGIDDDVETEIRSSGFEKVNKWLMSIPFTPKRRRTMSAPSSASSSHTFPSSPSSPKWKRYVPSIKRTSSSPSMASATRSVPTTPTRNRRLSLASLKRWSTVQRAHSLPNMHSPPSTAFPSPNTPNTPCSPSARRERRLSLASFKSWTSPSRLRTFSMTSSSTGGSSEFGVLANASDDGDDTLYDESSEPDASSSASGDDEDSVDSEDSDETLLTPLALFASSPTKLEKVEEGDEIDCFFATPTETMKRNADVDLDTSDLTIEISIPDTLAAKLLADTPLLNKVPDKKQQKHTHSPTLPSNAELATFPWPTKETISEPSPFPTIPDLCHDLNLTQSNIQMHSNASGKWYNLLIFLLFSPFLFLFASLGTFFFFILGVPLHAENRPTATLD
ncbi:hypothetical protein PC9H_011795 [Pleurotus ostreatus]|uniref:Uncharacterized protein n=1 Tax=Pleurotus ostreatus TaxID=5322 RepID=A0A8H7DNH3_PLEOS|nr:uncharacterized protein PC9H_011795 [Pleurotus ostreatus]KAF7421273.1 hypothetical protein PC9H_011795 [Pleurotus ostreatus]